MQMSVAAAAVLIALQPILANAGSSEAEKNAAKLYGDFIHAYSNQPCDSAWLIEPLHQQADGSQQGRFECYDQNMNATGRKYDLKFMSGFGAMPISIVPAN